MDGPYGERFKSFLHTLSVTFTSICTDLRKLRHKIEFLTYIDVFQHLLRCIVYKRLELGITDGNSVSKVLTSQWENKLYTPPKKTASPRFLFKDSSNNAMMMIIKAWSLIILQEKVEPFFPECTQSPSTDRGQERGTLRRWNDLWRKTENNWDPL